MPSIWMVCGWSAMIENVYQLRPKVSDSEKITINLGYVDLGHIDLMVQDGFYSNRTDFIRTTIRNQLERHAEVVKQSTARKNLDLGLRPALSPVCAVVVVGVSQQRCTRRDGHRGARRSGDAGRRLTFPGAHRGRRDRSAHQDRTWPR